MPCPGCYIYEYYLGSKITNEYPRKQGDHEKLTEQEQEDHARDERLPKLVFCADCSLVSCLYCVFFIVIICVATKYLQLDAYLGWLLYEMVRMLNI